MTCKHIVFNFLALLGTCWQPNPAFAHPDLPVLPLPTVIQDGDTILLACGRTYSGTLDLRGRRNVSVRTDGDCGRASITPALPVSGWVREGRIWSAALEVAPLMLQVGERFVPLAHHPNGAGQWLSGEGRDATHLQVNLAAHDLGGATLVWRAEDWLILSQTIASDDHGLLRIARPPEDGFGFPQKTAFYLEGQRWMLDSPGEWVHAQGRLMLWPADERSPEGRTWASAAAAASAAAVAIDARGSSDVSIQGLRIFLATRGIDGGDSRNLYIDDTEIINSGEEAIRIGGNGTRITGVRVMGTRQHGLRAEDDARDVSITDSRIEGAGMLGMPLRSKGAIVFEQASGQFIARNRIVDAAYIGIRAFRDAVVADNQISGACLRMTDCGGIYTFARDRQPLNMRIVRNRISGLRGRLSHAIYLDDFANGVIVRGNQSDHNPGGMQLHNAFDNLIEGNVFRRSAHEHVLFNETASFAAISGNQFTGNRFEAGAGGSAGIGAADDAPVYRLWSHHGGDHLSRFGSFARNRYISSPPFFARRFAQMEQQGWVSASRWREQMDEATSQFSAPGALPQLARQPQKK